VADYPLHIAFGTDKGIYINFYTPSAIRFTYGGTDIVI
jgi:hypothetical protein